VPYFFATIGTYAAAVAAETAGEAATVVLATVDGAVLVRTVARALFCDCGVLVAAPVADRVAAEGACELVRGVVRVTAAVADGLRGAALVTALDVVSTGRGGVVALSGT
jgi:hypothetical protein